MTTIEIGDRIAALMKSTGIGQSELGRRLGITPQAVQKWANGGSPRKEKIPEIAQAFGVTTQELVRGTVYDSSSSAEYPRDESSKETVRPHHRRIPISESQPNESDAMLPLISWAQAGMWAELMDKFSVEEAEELIVVPGKHSKRSFCLRIRDESMYNPGGAKSYAQDEVIAVNPDREPANRSTVVVKMPGAAHAILRQLLTDGDTMMLKALNPSWPNPLMELPADAEVIGTVTGKWVEE